MREGFDELPDGFAGSFLSWIQEHPEDGLPAREPVTLETMFDDFAGAIYRSGGDLDGVRQSFEAVTRELFDCSVNELFQASDVPVGEWLQLPSIVQKSYISALVASESALNQEASQGMYDFADFGGEFGDYECD